MASPISEVTPPGGDPYGQAGSTRPDTPAKAHVPDAQSGARRPGGDGVTLSSGAKARRMKEEGEPVGEIAKRLNIDVKTLERYLGVVPEPAEARAEQMKQQGESITQIAESLGVDVGTVNRYLGVLPVPAAVRAQQLKQQGESVLEIADRLGVDVKTVRRYLGGAASPDEAGAK